MKHKKFFVAATVLVASLALGACSNQKSNSQSTSDKSKPVKQDSKESEKEFKQKVAKKYNSVLDDVKKYSFDEDSSMADSGANYKYSYDLVKVEDQKAPLLVVKRTPDSNFTVDNVRIFSYNEKTKKEAAPDKIYQIGVAPAGGFRADLKVNQKGPFLEYLSSTSGSGDTETKKLEVKNNKIVEKTIWKGKVQKGIFDERFLTSEYKVLKWTDIANRSLLDKYAGKSATSEKPKKTEKKVSQKSQTSDLDEKIKQKKAAGMVVLKGKIVKTDHDGVLKMQNETDPNPDSQDTDTYYIFVLDQPQSVTFSTVGDMNHTTRAGEVKMIRLMNFNQDVTGSVTMAFNVKQTVWPTDTSVPLGQPKSEGYEILN
ncbi:hypothetical protein [Lactobacillus hominis]|uniref:hypothetical protein n=1 Tax=Lactobacillus hominis TaxID=1203033 RepID=UPI0023F55E21|nr:hypothetical protein [Lactobacillus hominis]